MRLHTLPARAVGGVGDQPVEVLLVGGEDHKVGQADDADARWSRLEEWARLLWPGLGRVAYQWSGEVMEPVDAIGIIGRNPNDADNVFIATGDTGMGMTHGTIAGMLLTDLIQGRDNPWAALYDPSRVRPRAVTRFVWKQRTCALTRWLTTGSGRSTRSLPHGPFIRRGSGRSRFATREDACRASPQCASTSDARR